MRYREPGGGAGRVRLVEEGGCGERVRALRPRRVGMDGQVGHSWPGVGMRVQGGSEGWPKSSSTTRPSACSGRGG